MILNKIMQKEKLIFINFVGADKSKSSDDKSKKLSLMQDLFGNTLHTSPSKESNVSKKGEHETSIAQYATEVPKPQTQYSTYAPTAFGTREPRRGKRTSEIINDPLGLLSLSAEPDQTQQSVNINLICLYIWNDNL